MADDNDRKPARRLSVSGTYEPPTEDHPTESGPFRRLLLHILWIGFRLVARGFAHLRPFTPQLVPLVVGLFLIPVLLFFSASAGFVVWKSSAVAWEHPLYLQYGDGVPPYADARLNIVVNQPYDVELHLVVPALSSNYALGNFMASLTISTYSNKTLATTRRPALILPPPSSTLPFVGKRNSFEITIPLLSAQTIGASKAVAHVEVGRKDNWRSLGSGEGRELSILSATLKGTLRHQGLRGLFTRFPLLTAIFASGTFFALAAAVVFGCLLTSTQFFSNYELETSTTKLEDATEGKALRKVKSREAFEERMARRRSTSKRGSGMFGDVKTEVTETSIPPADEDAEYHLRRRSSRSFKDDSDL